MNEFSKEDLVYIPERGKYGQVDSVDTESGKVIVKIATIEIKPTAPYVNTTVVNESFWPKELKMFKKAT